MRRKILIFVDWFEPGFKAGGPIQSCRNLVESLGDDFDFYLVTGELVLIHGLIIKEKLKCIMLKGINLRLLW
jgi:hypothetical protein